MNRLFALLSLTAVLVLVGCGGGSGSGAPTVVNQDTSNDQPDTVTYDGPDPASDDVQNFKVNVWDNLSSSERCGACHFEQTPAFVRSDDINLAYSAVNPLVNLEVPTESRLVTKVAGGHNCWEAVSSVCADIITGYIESWAQASGSVSNTIILTAPALRDVGETKNFPADATDYGNTVYPLVSLYCSGCHSEDAPTQQQPFIGSADLEVSYAAAKSRMDLTTPANSRLVTRLRSEFHNCWDDCVANANEMEQAIADFSALIPVTSVDPDLVISRAMGLLDGIAANGGGRVENNVIALWDFSYGTGATAFDRTGIEPAVNLSLSGNVAWVGSYGINIGAGGRAQALTQDSQKLYNMITATGEYTIEAWLVPGNVAQEGPARIVSYSGSATSRNFMLGQTLYNYNFLARSSTSDANGDPSLNTADADEVLQATLQHVVATFDPIEGRKLYVNGELVAEEAAAGGNLNAWDSSFALVLGSEVGGSNAWEGIIRFLAIYNRAMPVEDIVANFEVGVGQRYYVLFNVEDHVSVPEAYVAFEVSQFDDYAYLFSEPFFISLDNTATIGNVVHIEGMYLGVNGREAGVGQAFANVNVDITDASYQPGVGQQLSNLGTIVPLEFGPADDLFFLSFDAIGNRAYDRPPAPAPVAPVPEDLEPASDIGLKNFAEINATLSEVTGIPITDSRVAETYTTLQQQLPTVENIGGFLSAHQMGVTQLAVAYCNAMVQDAGGSLPARDQLIDDLLSNLLANNLAGNGGEPLLTQPHPDIASPDASKTVRTELTDLYNQIAGSSGNSAAAIATCAAATGNAIALLQ
ncbi:LamG domain-containing protein [Halioxenophilus sp. WMMB6]|uniref:LamG domain-containing protein n=1 Tax=Halioxenophilus sp. WMMB6 TaxID=3073815 RepID=UPI00295EB6CB|nr:LamG domain-containing protein [Halioxenophilus sp. WMMB6]